MKKLTKNVILCVYSFLKAGNIEVIFLVFQHPILTQKQLFALIIKSPV